MSKRKEKLLKNQAAREEKLRKQEKAGLAVRIRYEEKPKKPALPNRLSGMKTVEEEKAERQDTAEAALKVYRKLLPGLLVRLKQIKDPRSPKKVKHTLTVLMVYGILAFVFQISSRREANRQMDCPIFFENVKNMFPELETLPHADTLERFLEKIEVDAIQESLMELFEKLVRKKKFRNRLLDGRYLIAMDGTQKFYRNEKWAEECLERHVGSEQKTLQYYVYVLESVLILDNGVTLPFMSEILQNKEYKGEKGKQDCERRAFYRLAEKIKKRFPRLKIAVVLDGLYACGPVIRVCRDNGWDFMIVLKDESLKEVWKEALALMKLEPGNSIKCQWGDREQVYHWAGDIEYQYGENGRFKEVLHVVICEESWEETSRYTGKTKVMTTRYAWLSDCSITKRNVFKRCTRMGRYRWKIENNILVEKHQGYQYEHCFSYNWNAMEGYHYLMKIARFINVMTLNSEYLADRVSKLGISGVLKLLWMACAGDTLNAERIRKIVEGDYYLKLSA
jgi:hypothetical protein